MVNILISWSPADLRLDYILAKRKADTFERMRPCTVFTLEMIKTI